MAVFNFWYCWLLTCNMKMIPSPAANLQLNGWREKNQGIAMRLLKRDLCVIKMLWGVLKSCTYINACTPLNWTNIIKKSGGKFLHSAVKDWYSHSAYHLLSHALSFSYNASTFLLGFCELNRGTVQYVMRCWSFEVRFLPNFKMITR